MTYGELLAQLSTMSKEQLNMDVTVYLSDIDETYPGGLRFNTDEDMGEALSTIQIGQPVITA